MVLITSLLIQSLILVCIIGYVLNKSYKRYLNYKANKEKILKLQKKQKEMLQNNRLIKKNLVHSRPP